MWDTHVVRTHTHTHTHAREGLSCRAASALGGAGQPLEPGQQSSQEHPTRKWKNPGRAGGLVWEKGAGKRAGPCAALQQGGVLDPSARAQGSAPRGASHRNRRISHPATGATPFPDVLPWFYPRAERVGLEREHRAGASLPAALLSAEPAGVSRMPQGWRPGQLSLGREKLCPVPGRPAGGGQAQQWDWQHLWASRALQGRSRCHCQ